MTIVLVLKPEFAVTLPAASFASAGTILGLPPRHGALSLSGRSYRDRNHFDWNLHVPRALVGPPITEFRDRD